MGLKEYILFLEIVYSFILGGAAKLRWAGGGEKRPDGHGNEPTKTGARSAWARTRGQNPLVGQKKDSSHSLVLTRNTVHVNGTERRAQV